jgi:hypothetical protein
MQPSNDNDPVLAAAERCEMKDIISRDHNDSLFSDITRMIEGFDRSLLRPVHTNPETRKALGEDA